MLAIGLIIGLPVPEVKDGFGALPKLRILVGGLGEDLICIAFSKSMSCVNPGKLSGNSSLPPKEMEAISPIGRRRSSGGDVSGTVSTASD
tara:strand:- start:561 stop:830 length:270 start_codon:yes stop_codon:yes gene_type:complete